MRDTGRKDLSDLPVQASELLHFQMNEFDCAHSKLQSEHRGEEPSILNKPSLLKPALAPDIEGGVGALCPLPPRLLLPGG